MKYIKIQQVKNSQLVYLIFLLDGCKYFTQAALAQCDPQKAFTETRKTFLQNGLYHKSPDSPLTIVW